MKKMLLVLSLILPSMACQSVDREGTMPEGAFVSVSGRHIITPDGKPLSLKGVNLGFWLERRVILSALMSGLPFVNFMISLPT